MSVFAAHLRGRVIITGRALDVKQLAGGGWASDQILGFDWRHTPLGPMDTWPTELRTTLGLVLNSRFPMFLAWGPDRISFHNTAYRPYLGGKPSAIGRPVEEVWPEVWPAIEPLVAKAWAGEASWLDRLELTVERSGSREQSWRTASCSPVLLEDGSVGGVLWVVLETTEAVLAERRQAFLIALGDALRDAETPVEVMQAAAELIGRHTGVGRAGYGDIDPKGEVVRVERDWTRDQMFSLAGEARILDAFGPAVIKELRSGRTLVVEDCRHDPRTARPEFLETWDSIGTRALVVAPLRQAGRLIAILYLHSAEPRTWTDHEVTLVEDVARRTGAAVERARAESDLRSALQAVRLNQERFDLAQDAGGIGWWDWDLTKDQGWASDTFRRMHGLAVGGSPLSLSDVLFAIHPDDRPDYQARLSEALKQPEPTTVEYRVQRPDGAVRWISAKGRAIIEEGQPTKALGIAMDLTERKRAEERLRLLTGEVDHRANNLMAVVQATVALSRGDDPEGLRQIIIGRVAALARAHQLLAASRWAGADLHRLVHEELAPFVIGDDDRLSVAGPEVALSPAGAQGMAMILHELATNAAKHGALSKDAGRVALLWSLEGARLHLDWSETGGPPVTSPERRGYGIKVLSRALESLGGRTTIHWNPDGLTCSVDLPLATHQPTDDALNQTVSSTT